MRFPFGDQKTKLRHNPNLVPNFLWPVLQTGLSPCHNNIVIIKLKQWPAAGCEAKVAAELSSHPLAWERALKTGWKHAYAFSMDFFLVPI